MNFSKQLVKILSLFLCLMLGNTVFGNGEEEKEKTPKNTRDVKPVGLPKPTVATRASIVSAAEGSVAPAQVQSELDNKTSIWKRYLHLSIKYQILLLGYSQY